ncbi:MAG: antibiotic biosynthesis monooxygenase [Nitrospirae bacterium]|nr:antibiotic biosynthesis monooxygenase [Nitrospirota bacterium]
MILATLRMSVRPERRGDLLETIRGMLEPARVERGCLSYCLYEDIEDRNTFILIEKWKTQNDLESHLLTDNQRQILALMDFLSKQPELQFNTVSRTAGIELIEAVIKAGNKGTGGEECR